MIQETRAYEIRPREDKRGANRISDALPFGRLWHAGPNAASNAIGYVKFYIRSHGVVIRICDEPGYVIEMHEHAGDFREVANFTCGVIGDRIGGE